MTPNADDRLIWNLPEGSTLVATADVHIQLDPAAPHAFTSRKHYVVVSMHPIANPAMIKVIDDQGQLHSLAAEQVRLWFKRVFPAYTTA